MSHAIIFLLFGACASKKEELTIQMIPYDLPALYNVSQRNRKTLCVANVIPDSENILHT